MQTKFAKINGKDYRYILDGSNNPKIQVRAKVSFGVFDWKNVPMTAHKVSSAVIIEAK